MLKEIDDWLLSFDILLQDYAPKAYSIYCESRKSYLQGDIDRADRLKRLNYLIHNSEIPYTADIGKNSIFAYGGIGVIIHANAVIGERCNIGSGVTIGGDRKGVPIIGDDVYLATGSKVIGNVKIGDCVIVGANSVVLNDIKPFSVVAGIPAKVVSNVNFENFKNYENYYWCKGNNESISRFKDWYFIKKNFKMPS